MINIVRVYVTLFKLALAVWIAIFVKGTSFKDRSKLPNAVRWPAASMTSCFIIRPRTRYKKRNYLAGKPWSLLAMAKASAPAGL